MKYDHITVIKLLKVEIERIKELLLINIKCIFKIKIIV